MTVTYKELDLGMSLFLELIQADPSLGPLVGEARSEYFPGASGFSGDPRSAPAAEVRFLEWFLFERDHEGGLLVEALLPAWRELADPELALFESTFLGTCAGIYEVGDEVGDGSIWLRDIAGLGEYAVEVRITEGAIQPGDLIVGRLFPTGDSTHVLSPGAGCFREEELISAVYRDLENARQDRTHKALRIRQVDLEAMFWGDALISDDEDPVTALRSFLQDGGLSPEEVEGLIEVLSNRPVPSEAAGPFFIAAIQDLLDHLAFETELDLASAQEKFVACWLHLQAGGLPEKEPEVGGAAGPGKLAPKEALDAFDADRAAGFDAETAISRLSARLGIDEDEGGDGGEADASAPMGLADGLIEEFLWDLERAGGAPGSAHRGALALLRKELALAEVVEDITPRRILLICCTNLCEAPSLTPRERAEYAHVLFAFSQWCVEHHGHAAAIEVTEAFESLPGSILRISTLNETLDQGAIKGDWLCIDHSQGQVRAVSVGGEERLLVAGPELIEGLQSGDYVRASIDSTSAALRWCYPPELAAAERS